MFVYSIVVFLFHCFTELDVEATTVAPKQSQQTQTPLESKADISTMNELTTAESRDEENLNEIEIPKDRHHHRF